jgi:hypothetical protein
MNWFLLIKASPFILKEGTQTLISKGLEKLCLSMNVSLLQLTMHKLLNYYNYMYLTMKSSKIYVFDLPRTTIGTSCDL